MQMADEPDSLVLQMLREMRTENAKHYDLTYELLTRVGQLEQNVASIKTDIAHLGEQVALASVRVDSFVKRFDRIERRLGLIDA
jgi:phage shock protein A